MAQAVTQLFPGAKYSIGPAIENGFYYDFELPGGRTFSEDDLAAIEARMREIIAGRPAVHALRGLRRRGARRCSPTSPTRSRSSSGSRAPAPTTLDSGEVGGGDTISVYRNTPEFLDLCKGPHVPTTGRLGHFKLQRVSGAYWRGNEKGPMLQRIYGTAWESDAALKAHLEMLVEAEKRDHRRLATDLDLLSFPSEIGGGLAVWHPKGAIVRKLMEDYSRQRHQDGGYEFVFTPHLTKQQLFETSGHLDWYADGMYPPMEMDNGTYYMKPMNCPMHCLIFRSRQRSYRELPLRLFELGTVYRYERAGTLHGLMRIRGFTQDDSHIYCTPEQAPDEIASLLDFVLSVLRAFGFEDFTFNLSTKDPDKYVGTDEDWEAATAALRAALERHGLEYSVKEGDAAFYGPKIDIDVRDAIGRSWQLSTIQYDFNHPERFELEYVGADNARHRPIMLHRALFGSVERFFGVLLEHYAGNLPTWLSPDPGARAAGGDGPRGVRREGRRPHPRRRRPGRRRRRQRAARQAHPQRQAREAAVHPRGRRRRRRRRHRRRQRPGQRQARSWRRPRHVRRALRRRGAVDDERRPAGLSPTDARAALERLARGVRHERRGGRRGAARRRRGRAGERLHAHPAVRPARRRHPHRPPRRARASPSSTPSRTPSGTPSCCRTGRSPTWRTSTPDEFAELWATVTDVVRAIKAAYQPEGINVGVNLGRPAGGSVSEHLHVHVVPRWTGDGNFMTAIANTRTLPEALPDSAAKIGSLERGTAAVR